MLRIITIIFTLILLGSSELFLPRQTAQFVDCKGTQLTVTNLDLSNLQCPATSSICKMTITGKALQAFSVKQAVIDVTSNGVSMFKQTVAFISQCTQAGVCTISYDISIPVVIPSGPYTTKTILQNDKDTNLVCFTHNITI